MGTVLAALASVDPSPNPSMLAIARRFPDPPGWTVETAVPFSSVWKWSGVTFAGHGTWVIGATDVLLDEDDPAREQAQRHAAAGLRVLLLASATELGDSAAPVATGVRPVALVLLEQPVRADAAATLDYFGRQGVRVVVLSGDDPRTVGAIAERLGLPGADEPYDARELPSDQSGLATVLDTHRVFGRVTPQQKRDVVQVLQAHGHDVAMTGDGVNDVLALKDADIGVAMGNGSPATRSVAQIVLLDSRFSDLPTVVAEGRRVLGNIERVASLFLTKTVYACLMALAIGVLRLPFPFLPRHLTLISSLTIGIPGFFLALAPNTARVRSGFVPRVLRFAIPAGLVAGASSLAAYGLARASYGNEFEAGPDDRRHHVVHRRDVGARASSPGHGTRGRSRCCSRWWDFSFSRSPCRSRETSSTWIRSAGWSTSRRRCAAPPGWLRSRWAGGLRNGWIGITRATST